MIFIATSNATISASVPSVVSQGSVLANDIVILAPFAASTSVTCAFVLPNGIRTTEQLAAPLNLSNLDGIPPIKDELGQTYNAWSYTLNGALTEFPGDVTAQFYFRKSGGGILASTASTFNVQAGVPVELPDEPSQDIYSQILTALSALGNRVEAAESDITILTASVSQNTTDIYEIKQENARQDGQIDELQQDKVDRIFPSDETRVYAADPTGDVSFVLSPFPSPLTIPEYDIGGRLESNDPTAPEKVANKRYVDAQDASNRAYTDNNAVFRVEISIDPQTYVLTATARNAVNNAVSQSSVDLPLESMVVGAEVVTVGGVDKLRLTLQNGNTVDIDVSDIVDGLATNAALNAGLALKVNKDVDRAAGQTVVYSQSDSGNSALLVSQTPIQNALPQYGANGVLKVSAPTVDNDAANKRYVDAADTLLKGDIDALSTQFNRTYLERIEKNEKRIINLEQGLVPDPFETDSTVAYQKSVPANSLPYAALNVIGGMTATREFTFLTGVADLRCKALAPMTFTQFCASSYNVEYTAEGVETVNPFEIIDGVVFYHGTSSGVSAESLVIDWAQSGNRKIIYRELIPTKVTEVVSTGANLIPFPNVGGGIGYQAGGTQTRSGVTFSVNNDGSVALNGTTTEAVGFSLANNSFGSMNFVVGKTYCIGKGTDNSEVRIFVVVDHADGTRNNWSDASGAWQWREGDTLVLCYIQISNTGVTVDNVTVYPMVNEGSIALQYVPYRSPISIPISEEVQSLDAYGYDINSSLYNSIEWVDGKVLYFQRVGAVDMGTLNWTRQELANFSIPRFNAALENAKSGIETTLLSGKYTAGSQPIIPTETDMTICIYNGRVYVLDSTEAYTDASKFQASLEGVILCYELAIPVITDITDKITADNYISVEGNGALTFENQYKNAVPSNVLYQSKEATT